MDGKADGNLYGKIYDFQDVTIVFHMFISWHNRCPMQNEHVVQMQNVKFVMFPDWSIGQYRKI